MNEETDQDNYHQGGLFLDDSMTRYNSHRSTGQFLLPNSMQYKHTVAAQRMKGGL